MMNPRTRKHALRILESAQATVESAGARHNKIAAWDALQQENPPRACAAFALAVAAFRRNRGLMAAIQYMKNQQQE